MQVAKSPILRTFQREDPTQCAFRTAIAQLDEASLVDLENDLDAYSRSGILSSFLERLLERADGSFRQVA